MRVKPLIKALERVRTNVIRNVEFYVELLRNAEKSRRDYE
jgi:hypothetical protein